MGRRKGRVLAFQALYAWDAADDKDEALARLSGFSWLDDDKREALGQDGDFARLLIAGAVENIPQIDEMLKRHLKNWDFDRLKAADRAVLRISAFALMFQDTPPEVVIDEAVDIAKQYCEDDSYKFVNGVLDSVKKTVQEEKNGNG